jgi:hypothetical protein
MCDRHFVVARTTRFIVRANDVAPEGGVRFSCEIVITSGSFPPGQVLSFGSLDNVAKYNGKLHPFEETLLEDNESPASYPQLAMKTNENGWKNPIFLLLFLYFLTETGLGSENVGLKTELGYADTRIHGNE